MINCRFAPILFILLVGIIMAGCSVPVPQEHTSPAAIDRSSTSTTISAINPSNVSPTMSSTTSALPEFITKDNEMYESWHQGKIDSYQLAQNSTAHLITDPNRSCQISLGSINIQNNETSGTTPSSIIRINMTATNTGKVPVHIVFTNAYLLDSNGYQYSTYGQSNSICDSVFFGSYNASSPPPFYWLYPGKTDSKIVNCTIFITDRYQLLLSKKSLYSGLIDAMYDKKGSTFQPAWVLHLGNVTEIT
jgi:hypothetical protein